MYIWKLRSLAQSKAESISITRLDIIMILIVLNLSSDLVEMPSWPLLKATYEYDRANMLKRQAISTSIMVMMK